MGAIKSVLHFITIETSVARKNLFVLLRCFLCLFACLFFVVFFLTNMTMPGATTNPCVFTFYC